MPPVLTAQAISKTYGHHTLFSGIGLVLQDRERLALIGPNGSGKSTLLKLLAGMETADEGSIVLRKGLRAAYVSQMDRFPEGATVLSAVCDGLKSITLPHVHDDHERELHAELTLRRLGFEELGLGDDFLHAEAARLSGGQRKRLSIIRELAKEPDILLLDEPTNHLDVEGIRWLEEILDSAQFAWVAVTHDRAFLENTATRIVELSRAYPGGTFGVQGNYSEFLRRKQEFLEGQARQEASLANMVREDLRWLGRKAQARRTKAKSRAASAHSRIAELAELKARNAPQRAAAVDFGGTDRKTQKLLQAHAISKSLGGRTLFRDLNVILSPGQKLGLMGPNGSGKSTLIKVLTGELASDAPSPEAVQAAKDANLPSGVPPPGEIRRADNLRVVLFSQHRTELDPSKTLRDTLSPADSVIYQGRVLHVNTWAAMFLFDQQQMKAPIRALSGGEQARVHIARLMLEPADVLILDEPTNDLDIATLEVLETSLEEFPGALVLVTHDRAMVADLATQVLALDGKGGAKYYASYDQWEDAQELEELEAKARVQEAQAAARGTSPPSPSNAASASGAAPAASKKKLSYKEQRELEQIEPAIEKAEAEVARLEALVNDAGGDHKRVQQLYVELGEAQARVAALYERWGELSG
ncbi:MAG TPA: ABC-F family ATP-binding cassette domain-containing protein [Phycisphaerales bacterium]|nr:ABC-F family ATP-binding cassette domain-containing protein [Phycisphaerales bacterium]